MRQLCARARVRARIVAGYAKGNPWACRGLANGLPWACHARRIVAGFAGHSAGARGAWHDGGIQGRGAAFWARGVAWRIIRGGCAETAQTVDL